MNAFLAKVFVTLILLAPAILNVVLARSALKRVWKVKNVDQASAISLIYQAFQRKLESPFSGFGEAIREDLDLILHFTPIDGYTFPPGETKDISAEYLTDRKQYSLKLENPSADVFRDLEFRLQFPYPVGEGSVAKSYGCREIRFVADGLSLTAKASGTGAAVKWMKRATSRSYILQIAEIQPGGNLEILVLLDNTRDPKVRSVSPEKSPYYLDPEVRESLTYINGKYVIEIGGGRKTCEYFAPFSLTKDKIVILGSQKSPPTRIEKLHDLQ